MRPSPYEQVPLTADEKSMLFTIYDSRRRFLLIVYIFLILLGVVVYFKGIWIGYKHIRFKEYYEDVSIPTWVAAIGGLEAILIGSGLYFLFTRVLPFRKDIKSGMKEKVPFVVLKKQYFSISDQYYLTLDDPKYEYHVTDADTYYAVNEGDKIYLYRAPWSKYVFEENGKFTIL